MPAIIGVAIGSVTATYAPSAVFKIAFVIFATFISARMLIGTDRLNLGDEIAGPRLAKDLRLHHRAVFFAGRRQRRRGIERGAHALRPADAARGRNVGRRRRADHHCRHHRLHAGRLAAYGADAAFVDRFCVCRRFCADGAGVELHGEIRCAAGALAAAAQTRNRFRYFSDVRVAAIYLSA